MRVIILDKVNLFTQGLDGKVRARIKKCLDILEYFGYKLRMPYSKCIMPGIYELRIINQGNVRLIYTFKDNNIIIFYGFVKNTDKISTKEMHSIQARYNSL